MTNEPPAGLKQNLIGSFGKVVLTLVRLDIYNILDIIYLNTYLINLYLKKI